MAGSGFKSKNPDGDDNGDRGPWWKDLPDEVVRDPKSTRHLELAPVEPWEPNDAGALTGWVDSGDASSEFAGAGETLYRSWLLLDPPRRRQWLRELEISNFLLSNPAAAPPVQGEDPHYATSVTTMRFGEHAHLVACYHVDRPWHPSERVDDQVGVLEIPTEIPGAQTIVPVVIRYRRRPDGLDLGGTRQLEEGEVGRGIFRLQPGDRIYGETPAGFTTPGTLGLFCRSQDPTAEPMLVSAGHVLGERGSHVLTTPNSAAPVAAVTDHCDVLDIASAQMYRHASCQLKLPFINKYPGAPIPAVTNMPVQMFGAESGHTKGRVTDTNFHLVGAVQAGLNPYMVLNIEARGGDSGALIITGHGTTPLYSADQVRYMNPAFVHGMNLAMVGVLKAGAKPDEAGIADVVATPIIPILDRLQLEPLCTIHKEGIQ